VDYVEISEIYLTVSTENITPPHPWMKRSLLVCILSARRIISFRPRE